MRQEESFEQQQLVVEKQQFTADFGSTPVRGRASRSGKQLKGIDHPKSESKHCKDLKKFLNTPSKNNQSQQYEDLTQFQKSQDISELELNF